MTSDMPSTGASRRWPPSLRRPTFKEAGVFLLVVNLFVMAALFWKVHTDRAPVIATVSVTQLSRTYGQQFAADPANTPEMIRLKTGIFLATTEKLIGASAQDKNMIVFARECVLTGDSVDLTPQITAAVDHALKSGGLNSGEALHVSHRP